jgi:hypothetical protein
VNRNSFNLIDPDAANSVVISHPGGSLFGVATSYQFSPDPPRAGIGCTANGAILTVSIAGGTRRFASVTGGQLSPSMDTTWLSPIEEFPSHFAQSVTGTITGSLQRSEQ